LIPALDVMPSIMLCSVLDLTWPTTTAMTSRKTSTWTVLDADADTLMIVITRFSSPVESARTPTLASMTFLATSLMPLVSTATKLSHTRLCTERKVHVSTVTARSPPKLLSAKSHAAVVSMVARVPLGTSTPVSSFPAMTLLTLDSHVMKWPMLVALVAKFVAAKRPLLQPQPR
jgi:hypothetical protein